MKMQMKQRAAAGMMTGAAALAIAGFTALGSIFDYRRFSKPPPPKSSIATGKAKPPSPDGFSPS